MGGSGRVTVSSETKSQKREREKGRSAERAYAPQLRISSVELESAAVAAWVGAVFVAREDAQTEEGFPDDLTVVLVQAGEESLEWKVSAGKAGVLASKSLKAAEDSPRAKLSQAQEVLPAEKPKMVL